MEDLTSQDLLELDHREQKQMEAKVNLQVLAEGLELAILLNRQY